MQLTIHYRGPLSSCNYGCGYCPFAKAREARSVLQADRDGLARFVSWAETSEHELSILFTPWGEALVRRWYREAMVRLSHRVKRVAAQTNLSMKLDWLDGANRESLALWTTWHPGECSLDQFLRQTQRLDAMGIRYSVGVVGLREHFDAIAELRERTEAPLWVNAYKREAAYYTPQERAWLSEVDPRFDDNREHPSLGRACRAGQTHFTVDGVGDVRRCHFVDEPVLGNLYDGSLEAMLRPRTCPNAVCRCHIGYVHLEHLRLYEVYGEGLMERRLP